MNAAYIITMYEKYIKRFIDIVIAAVLLFLFLPVFALVSYLIRKEDGGSVFYKGERIGKNGVPFKMYKFRTMVMNADKVGGSSTSDNDPRITKVGKALRKYKIDELPQLINVLKGEMSIVGPRPEVKEYVELYTEDEKRILRVRPGMTDWASIWNPDEGNILAKYEDPDKAYMEVIRPKKLELQKKYVEELSLSNDIRIIIKTIKILFAKLLTKGEVNSKNV